MKACVLASGSKGNVCYVETNNHKILIDMGKSKKYVVDNLKRINVDAKEIDVILISHLHKDHISALETFIKQYNTTVYMPKKMFLELESIKNYSHIIIYEDEIILDDTVITSIKSSHDSIDSRNFIIENNNNSVVYITDTGYIRNKYLKQLNNRDLYLLESNHDIEMLTHGPYPEWLKKRVYGNFGHLSNQSAGFYLTKLIGDNTKKVILMHLSEVNNSKEIALETVKDVLKEYDINFKDIVVSSQDTVSEVINL